MELCFDPSFRKLYVPVEIFNCIMQHTDRLTRAELRLTCRALCAVAASMVFDKLRVESSTETPAGLDLATFNESWVDNQLMSTRSQTRERSALRQLVKSITIDARVLTHSLTMDFLSACPNLIELRLIAHRGNQAGILICMAMEIALDSTQIKRVALVGNFSGASLCLSVKGGSLSVTDVWLRIMPEYPSSRFPPEHVRISLELPEIVVENFAGAPHLLEDEVFAIDCPFHTHNIPSVERATIAVPRMVGLVADIRRTYLQSLIENLSLIYPRLRILVFGLGKHRVDDEQNSYTNGQQNLQEADHQLDVLFPSLERISIYHPAENDFHYVLEKLNITGINATRRQNQVVIFGQYDPLAVSQDP
ncbi:hypothetical protein BC940DRAFT_298599 [Gongronella butleri]|nr:hypothetical protein BC940DRAFT_298599 [Gongronella butleri]